MAISPGRLEDAIVALEAQLVADLTWANVVRRTGEVEPELLAEPESWPNATEALIAIRDGDGKEAEGEDPEIGRAKRPQQAEVDVEIYLYSRDRDTASTAFHTRRRDAMNAIEAVFVAHPYANGWQLNWHGGWRRLRNQYDRHPFTAFAIPCRVKFQE